VILILGQPADSLIREVSRNLADGGLPALCIAESELCSEVSFTLEQSRAGSTGTLHVNGTVLQLPEVSSVLVRLPRMWWPSQEFGLQDQLFVYHEYGAAWFALLNSLSCPVINRFNLGWWLNDITYPSALACSLAQWLGIPVRIDPPGERLLPRILPVPPSPSYSSAYVAGQALIPRNGESTDACDWLRHYMPSLARWQQTNDAQLCRLDFEQEGRIFCLRHVEMFPLFEDEPAELVHRISDATVEMMA
jgi:hypothetical protein